MLPGVNANDRNVRTIDNVLVWSSDNLKSTVFLVLDNPSPSRTLNAGKLGVDSANKLVQTTVVMSNGFAKGRVSSWRLTTTLRLGSKVLPEERVVDVATTVESNGGSQVDLGSNVTVGLGLSKLLNSSVVTVDISLVVLKVVELIHKIEC